MCFEGKTNIEACKRYYYIVHRVYIFTVNPASKDTGASTMSKSHAQIYMATPKTNNLVDVFQSKRPNLYEKGII